MGFPTAFQNVMNEAILDNDEQLMRIGKIAVSVQIIERLLRQESMPPKVRDKILDLVLDLIVSFFPERDPRIVEKFDRVVQALHSDGEATAQFLRSVRDGGRNG